MLICQENKICTACGACKNICPKDAIQMNEDSQGFLYPLIDKEKCVNCNFCKNVCKNIDLLTKNFPVWTFASQSKNSTLSQKSSSGGMFAELARYVLSQNGVVFGCTMERVEDGFDVKHIYIENENNLYRLQGSKYVQSKIGNTLKQAKEFLEQGRFVLFSGTPCQIAGLKAFLKNQSYENLLTVDLSCTGTPSLKMFNAYIKFLEDKYKQKIINFEFRNKKKMGWCCGNALITFESGKQKVIYNSSSYLNLFINGGIHRESCYNCQFTGLNRVSDMTIADCWGIEVEYPKFLKQNGGSFIKDRGISLVLINTQKGEKIFDEIKENLYVEDIDIIKLKKYNGPLRYPIVKNTISRKYLPTYEKNGYKEMDKQFKKNLGWKYYYYKIKERTPRFVKNMVRLFMRNPNKNADCLLLTWFNSNNYGSVLTAYALKESIKKLGFSARYINNGLSIGYAKEFNKKYAEKTNLCLTNKDFEKLNNLSNIFIVGADNQLDYSVVKDKVYQNLLDFANASSKKIIISGSFGFWNWEEEPNVMKNLELLLKRFDFIATREDISKQQLKEKFNIDAEWFMDPVFFLEKSDYEKLIENARTNDYKKSIMSYIISPNKETDKIIVYLKEKYHLKVDRFYANELATQIRNKPERSVENWLKAVKDSKFIVTDSFHCIAFALIFNRPVIFTKNRSDARFLSMFSKLNIDIPLCRTYNDFIQNLENKNELDFNHINKIISINREQYLKTIRYELLNNNIKKELKEKIEKLFSKSKKSYYSGHNVFYKQNKFLYVNVIYPLVAPIIRKVKKEKFKRALRYDNN